MKKILYRIVLVLCLLLLIYSSYSIIKWFLENNKSNDIKTHVVKITAIEEEKDKYPYISIDFTNLLKENNKVKGWIQVPNTNINYPVLQYSDNDYYLNHDYYNNYCPYGNNQVHSVYHHRGYHPHHRHLHSRSYNPYGDYNYRPTYFNRNVSTGSAIHILRD